MINEKMAMEANENFYKAFNARDLGAMKRFGVLRKMLFVSILAGTL